MPTLADRYIPHPEHAERHSIVIDAPRERVWAALHDLKASDIRAARPLFAVRNLVSRLLHGHAQNDLPVFDVLEEVPGSEIVQGVVGQWWRLGAATNLPVADWESFDLPGYGKAVFSFHLSDLGGGRVLLTTETRVITTSPDARRAMARYWAVIRLGSGFVRRVMLGALKRRAMAR
ncbi:hypothetical protein AB0B45_39630 [Nonomuraea sp. NPDC049152]|uniref:hypothetical protein n=1 Tax=Nonomuraea sp. NPDC049152 TaxID=3154350 RepID=UPI0033F0E4E7